MRITPVILLATLTGLSFALPESASAPKPLSKPRAATASIPILPPVDLPNPLSLLTVFGTCVTGCIEVSIATETNCTETPTSKCVCPSMKEVLIQASPCFKTCTPKNLLAQAVVLAAVACKVKEVN